MTAKMRGFERIRKASSVRHFLLLIARKLPALEQLYTVTDRIRRMSGIFFFCRSFTLPLYLLISGV